MIANGQADVMLGVYEGDVENGYYGSHPLDKDIVEAAVTPEMAANWQGQASLEGKRVAALNGYDMANELDVKVKYKEVSNLKSLLKMLNKKRIDVVLGYVDDFKVAEKDLKEKNYEFKSSVIVKMSFPVFAKTKKGKKYQQMYNKGILEMHESGKLKALMKKSVDTLIYYPF